MHTLQIFNRGLHRTAQEAAVAGAIFSRNFLTIPDAYAAVQGVQLAAECLHELKSPLHWTISRGEEGDVKREEQYIPLGAAQSAMHMVEGLCDHDNFVDALEINGDNGGTCDGMYLEMIPYAELAHRLYLEGLEKHGHVPAVYDYSVSEIFGDWFCGVLLDLKRTPLQEEAETRLRELDKEFWLQGVKDAGPRGAKRSNFLTTTGGENKVYVVAYDGGFDWFWKREDAEACFDATIKDKAYSEVYFSIHNTSVQRDPENCSEVNKKIDHEIDCCLDQIEQGAEFTFKRRGATV